MKCWYGVACLAALGCHDGTVPTGADGAAGAAGSVGPTGPAGPAGEGVGYAWFDAVGTRVTDGPELVWFDADGWLWAVDVEVAEPIPAAVADYYWIYGDDQDCGGAWKVGIDTFGFAGGGVAIDVAGVERLDDGVYARPVDLELQTEAERLRLVDGTCDVGPVSVEPGFLPAEDLVPLDAPPPQGWVPPLHRAEI